MVDSLVGETSAISANLRWSTRKVSEFYYPIKEYRELSRAPRKWSRHHGAIGCLATWRQKLWVRHGLRDSFAINCNNCYLLVATQLWTSMYLRMFPFLKAQTQHLLVSSKQKNVHQFFRRHFASSTNRFHSFSRQSNAVVTFECCSFMHFGTVSPQNFPEMFCFLWFSRSRQASFPLGAQLLVGV